MPADVFPLAHRASMQKTTVMSKEARNAIDEICSQLNFLVIGESIVDQQWLKRWVILKALRRGI